MKPRTFTSVIVYSLLVIFGFSLMPVSAGGLQNSGSPAKRTKNGGATEKKPVPPTETEAAKGSDQTAPAQDKHADEKTPVSSSSESGSARPQGKKEPLPFDRPPLNDSQNSTGTREKAQPDFDRPTSSSTPPTVQSQRPGVSVQRTDSSVPSTRSSSPPRPPSNQPARSSQPSETWDRETNSGSRNAPPVLRREPDSRNSSTGEAGRDPRGAPPVLTRPTDPTRTNPAGSGTPARSPQQQGSGAQPANDDEPIKLEGTLVNIPVLVSDRSNRYVSQLGVKDFQLYEDGVQQEVAFFGNEEVPFSVALLLDMSPSVQDNQDAIQEAAVEFVRQLRPQDRVMVVSFAKNVDFLTDFTSDRRMLERAIRSTTTGSGTSVYEAVYRTVADRFRGVDGRKALILISDGEDTTSRGVSYDDAINIVTEADVLVYGLRFAGSDGNIQVNPWPRNRVPNIGIPLPLPFPFPFPRRRRGPFTSGNLLPGSVATPASTTAGQWPRRGRGDFMTDITNAGGGPVFNAQTIRDYHGLAIKIAEELRHVYVVSYYPTNPLSNGGYRAIRLRVRNRDDIAVRHRKGYNAKDILRGH